MKVAADQGAENAKTVLDAFDKDFNFTQANREKAERLAVSLLAKVIKV